jgi:transcriptional antiterminator RfaH
MRFSIGWGSEAIYWGSERYLNSGQQISFYWVNVLMKQWYALYTKPRAEVMVTASLKKRGIETYLPETTTTAASQTPKRVPFFPCYLFIRVDLEVDNPALWQWTPGVQYIVSYGNWPVPLPNEVINLIKHKLGEYETQPSRSAHKLEAGEIDRINKGPFQNMVTVFNGPTTPVARVSALLSSLSNSARLRFASSALERVSGAADVPVDKRPRRTRGRGRRIN